MKKFLGRDSADTSHKWPEWALQAYVVQEARRSGFMVIGDMAQGKRNPSKAKSQGLLAGHPDLSFWLSGGRVALMELKTATGVLSEAQRAHHAKLAVLGHKVYVIYGASPLDTWEQVQGVLDGYAGDSNG